MNANRILLKEITKTMDIPFSRLTDARWLSRNMGILNRNHKDYNRARELVRAILRGEKNNG